MAMHTSSSVIKEWAAQAVRGFCMGTADIVPGVSGGTIALIMGIYERLIANIHTGAQALGRAVKLDAKGSLQRLKEVEWGFLISLLAGIGAALLLLSHFIEELLIDYPEEMAGIFFGLVAASVVISWGQVSRWTTNEYLLLTAVAIASFVMLGFQSGVVSDPTLLQFFIAGAIAICAMILPGISGSFLLLTMGMYAAVLHAVNEREMAELGIFMLGAVFGLALFSTLLSYLLDRYHDLVLAALIGLMIGSIRVLWPWPNGVGTITDVEEELVEGTALGWPEDAADFLWPTVLAIAAFAIVLGLAKYGARRDGSAADKKEPLTAG